MYSWTGQFMELKIWKIVFKQWITEAIKQLSVTVCNTPPVLASLSRLTRRSRCRRCHHYRHRVRGIRELVHVARGYFSIVYSPKISSVILLFRIFCTICSLTREQCCKKIFDRFGWKDGKFLVLFWFLKSNLTLAKITFGMELWWISLLD